MWIIWKIVHNRYPYKNTIYILPLCIYIYDSFDVSIKASLQPKCELPKVIIRHNIGPTSAANIRLLLLEKCRSLHRSSAGLTTAAFVDCLNLLTFSRNLAQYRSYTKLIVTVTMASINGTILATDHRQIFDDAGPLMGRI